MILALRTITLPPDTAAARVRTFPAARAPHPLRMEHDMKETIHFTLNGKRTIVEVDTDRALLWVLRTDLGLTGTKYGCGQSFCGACTVLLNGEAVRSCATTMKEVRGKEVVTIEGLSAGDRLHPLQKAFMETDALQCGYCTPGMIMNAAALLRKIPHPSRDDIIREMDDNLCRCGAHTRIIQAVEIAARDIEGGH